jgi:hypothetical protein
MGTYQKPIFALNYGVAAMLGCARTLSTLTLLRFSLLVFLCESEFLEVP